MLDELSFAVDVEEWGLPDERGPEEGAALGRGAGIRWP